MRKRVITVVFLMSAIFGAVAGKTKEEKFIDDLMARMTLEEKLGQLNLPTGGDLVTGSVRGPELESLILQGKMGGFFNVKGVEEISRLQHIAVEKGPHGIPLLVGADVIHGYETVFPIPLALSCSWNPSAVERMARISAIEATADGINWNFSPMVDIARDPRWGRIAEGAGEDPYLGSEMAKAYIRGYQGKSLKADNTLMACVKHFALYGGAEGGRDYNTVDMSWQRMFNCYLPPYKAAVEAGAASVMTSFNLINGTHATAADWLVNDVLRKQWGFGGMVVTDYNSVPEMDSFGISDPAKAAALTLKAGTDMEMVSGLYLDTFKDALAKGEISIEMIDRACRRILEAKQKLGLFEDPYKYCDAKRTKTEEFTPEHRAAAREIAAETFVLLKNEGNLLPLAKKGKILLVGPLADAGNNMCGMWSGFCHPEKHSSLLDAFREAVGDNAEIIYAQGSNIYYDEAMQKNSEWPKTISRGDDATLHQEALAAASEADVIVAALGESAEMSGESSSRAYITIPDTQRDLLRELAATGKPVVLLLFTGRPLVLDWENENVAAILNVWFGGSEAGAAIADVVFGDKTPSGKLTTTWPQAIGQIPLYYNHLESSHPDTEPGVFNKYISNYIDISNDPLYPFGYGLSYTTFEYGEPTLSSTEMSMDGSIEVSVDITNTGGRDGVEIAQLYIRDRYADIARPVKELKKFARVFVKAGSTERVTFTLTPEDLKYYSITNTPSGSGLITGAGFTSEIEYKCDPGQFEVMVGPDSRRLSAATFTLIP